MIYIFIWLWLSVGIGMAADFKRFSVETGKWQESPISFWILSIIIMLICPVLFPIIFAGYIMKKAVKQE